jgi:hypothetical protein
MSFDLSLMYVLYQNRLFCYLVKWLFSCIGKLIQPN